MWYWVVGLPEPVGNSMHIIRLLPVLCDVLVDMHLFFVVMKAMLGLYLVPRSP